MSFYKKKDPLVLPPEYEELPLPKSKKEKSKFNSNMLGSSQNKMIQNYINFRKYEF